MVCEYIDSVNFTLWMVANIDMVAIIQLLMKVKKLILNDEGEYLYMYAVACYER